MQNNLADELAALGELDEAIVHEQKAIAIWEGSVGPKNIDVATGLLNLGNDFIAKRDPASAIAPLRRSLDIATEVYGASHYVIVGQLLALAEAVTATGGAVEARALRVKALAIDAKLSPTERSYELPVRVSLGEAQLALGDAARAVETLEPALPAAGTEADDTGATLSRARFALARALVESGGDRRRARALADEARKEARAQGGSGASDADKIERWIASL
jgi:tetratricopeptide (TPR) repeat protein